MYNNVFVHICSLLPIANVPKVLAAIVAVLDPRCEEDMVDSTENGTCVLCVHVP